MHAKRRAAVEVTGLTGWLGAQTRACSSLVTAAGIEQWTQSQLFGQDKIRNRHVVSSSEWFPRAERTDTEAEMVKSRAES